MIPARLRSIVLAASAALALAAGPALAAGDAAIGAKVAKRCAACYSFAAGKNKVGPTLAGVFGRKAGAIKGYKYSSAIKAAAAKGLVWDEENLIAYLADPKKFLRSYTGDAKARNKMTSKLRKASDRNNIVAHLKGQAK